MWVVVALAIATHMIGQALTLIRERLELAPDVGIGLGLGQLTELRRLAPEEIDGFHLPRFGGIGRA